ncbi:hypothetical protein EVAR_46974_1 [Eumeta japonica]|uniref:Uncharacterized protein n=1 Tax=Eumeta variegata TaxID=151549 RepID=A0A4C1X6X2_EUMVA|nr:hypothetical protein EVAR_46974_1 [Eumeta japonica]
MRFDYAFNFLAAAGEIQRARPSPSSILSKPLHYFVLSIRADVRPPRPPAANAFYSKQLRSQRFSLLEEAVEEYERHVFEVTREERHKRFRNCWYDLPVQGVRIYTVDQPNAIEERRSQTYT